MENTNTKKFKPTICECCKQTTDYALNLDKGTAHIMIAIANAVKFKNLNRVHLRNDMEANAKDFSNYREMISEGRITSRMIDNILRAKYHGLVAQVDGGGAGEYLLTPKGARFLKGEPMPRTAVVDKATHSKKYYYDEDDKVTIFELLRKEEMWDIPQFTVEHEQQQNLFS